MDMQWLDDVLILLEEQNLTRAAARRNITQPAFSRRIRSFEDWLGVRILERGKNSIEISLALRENEPEIRALTSRLRELKSKISNSDQSSASVTIAAQHAPIFSTFPSMAVLAHQRFPSLKFRLRAGNQRESVTLFLRGDAEFLLCYEGLDAAPLPFDSVIRRVTWGTDRLVPVVGGSKRFSVAKSGSVPADTPSMIYPQDSYFGEILHSSGRAFGTRDYSENPICETAFSNGIKEMALKGVGVGWLPVSMAHREIESGDLVSLSNVYGTVSLEIALYANSKNQIADALLDIWGSESPSRDEEKLT
ncbi:MAG: LysR family transcriptional regulator [Silicimonas sp.]|nr:LysR family transcriptional regulator [Silicimonas sp.]